MNGSRNLQFSIFLYFLIPLCLFTSFATHAQKPPAPSVQPLDIVREFFSANGIKHKEKYLCCDAKEHEDKIPYGKNIADNIRREANLLYADNKTAVINVMLIDTTTKSNPLELYVFLRKENDNTIKVIRDAKTDATGDWKIEAIRTLPLSRQLNRNLDELRQASKDDISRCFDSQQDYEFELANTTLAASPDKDIVQFLNTNIKKFDTLLTKTKEALYSVNETNIKRVKWNAPINKLLKELLLRNIVIGSDDCPDCIYFILDGIIATSVGFMYVQSGIKPLKPDPDKYISLRETGRGWYVYKMMGKGK